MDVDDGVTPGTTSTDQATDVNVCVNGLSTEESGPISKQNSSEVAPKIADERQLASKLYERYVPQEADFKPDPALLDFNKAESVRYWHDVFERCGACCPEGAPQTKRRTFAFGGTIIKTECFTSSPTGRPYAARDRNEVAAVKIAEQALPDLLIPKIYLQVQHKNHEVLVRSRIPGISLDQRWVSLTAEIKARIKCQVRDVIRRLRRVEVNRAKPSYVFEGFNQLSEHETNKDGYDILFGTRQGNDDVSFVHNNLLPSNIILDDEDRVVGIVGWAEAGYFGIRKTEELHRRIRCPACTDSADGKGHDSDDSWVNLYDFNWEDTNTSTLSDPVINPESAVTAGIARTPSASTINDVEQAATQDPQQQNDTDVKIEALSKKFDIDSSPVSIGKAVKSDAIISTKKRAAPTTTKKDPATNKPAAKKRKIDAQDAKSRATSMAPSNRSATPSIRGGKTGPKNRKQSSMSVAGSPAPDAKKTAKTAAGDYADDGDDDDINPSELFCICQKPDNHTWMIACDGGCNDWFHGECVKIKQSDGDLIDKYICPSCEERIETRTTWKPMCRLPGCRRPARVKAKIPSKYCGDEHGREFMRLSTQRATKSTSTGGPALSSRKEVSGGSRISPITKKTPGSGSVRGRGGSAEDAAIDPNGFNSNDDDEDDDTELEADEAESERDGPEHLSSRGGAVLTAGELKAVVSRIKSAAAFRKLGESILSSEREELSSRGIIRDETRDELDVDLAASNIEFTAEEYQQIRELRIKRDELRNWTEMLQDRDKFLHLVRQNAKTAIENLRHKDPKASKDICGFDSRLSWSDEEFNEWRLSELGQRALTSGTLGAAQPKSEHEANGDDDKMGIVNIVDNMCLKKRCERHKQWIKVQQQDILFEQAAVRDDLVKCNANIKDVVERVVLRVYGQEDVHHSS